MSSGIVRKAKGRPRKGSIAVIEPPPKPQQPESNRKSGSMSLRPNKRVRLCKTEFLTESDVEQEDDIIEDFAQDDPLEDTEDLSSEMPDHGGLFCLLAASCQNYGL